MILPKLGARLAFGGDYNPEQWPESVWPEDMRLMVEAGINLVCVNIFGWARLQPTEQTWDLEWLERVLDLLLQHGISACLGTATASPPPWLVAKHPDILPVTEHGVTLASGSRQHYSPHSPAYREAAAILVRRLAERFGSHPAVVGWHINNEYACHVPACHGPHAAPAFREWLRARYGTLENLNAAWCGAFWSQLYSDWSQIETPRHAPTFRNPTQLLDFQRFTSAAYLDLFRMEKAILRELTPDLPVTTNFMSFHKPLDYQAWAPELDFAAWDCYPDPSDELAARETAALGHDLTRSLKPGVPFLLMEQATSHVHWRTINTPKRPGLMRVGSLQSLLRGSDGAMFFQIRASKGGAEKYHSAVIPHGNPEHSRSYREVRHLGEDLRRLAPLAGSTIDAKVAIVFDWESWWALENDGKPARFELMPWIQQIHRWFYHRNLTVDFVPPTGDLSRYTLVLAPALYLLQPGEAQHLEAYVSQGGQLLVTYFSGIVDEQDQVLMGGYPATLSHVLGLWVEEWHPYPPGCFNHMVFNENLEAVATAWVDLLSLELARCDHWCDLVHLAGAEALATFQNDYFSGRPAFTRHTYGSGTAYYLATRPDEVGLDRVLRDVCQYANLPTWIDAPPGVEASIRSKGNQRFLCLVNHTDQAQEVPLRRFHGRDLLTGQSVSDQVHLIPLGAMFIQLTSAAMLAIS